MRLPNHIILDFENKQQKNNNWHKTFVNNQITYNSVFDTFSIENKFFKKKFHKDKMFGMQEKYTIKHSQQTKKMNLLILTPSLSKSYETSNTTNFLKNQINIHFLRKERLYTKLKYSRSPAYDIVSGGAAALLAAFVGFLISEKFGFELVDSGDFYYFFMYAVFAGFSLRPIVFSMDSKNSLKETFSPKFFLSYYLMLLTLLFRKN